MIVLYILLAILLLIALLLFLPVTLLVEYQDKLQLHAKYAFFTFDLLQQKPKKQKKEEPKQSKQPVKKRKGFFLKIKDKPYQGLEGFIDFIALVVDSLTEILPIVGKLLKKVRVKTLRLHMTVTGEDACQTAIQFGKINAYLYSSYAFLSNCVQIEKTQFAIRPDYTGGKNQIALNSKVQIRVVDALIALLKLAIYYIKL